MSRSAASVDSASRGLETSFERFERSLAYLEAKEKGDRFEVAVRELLTSDPVYRGDVKQAWLYRDWPGKLPGDIPPGIDLVAETFHGELWSIQCKAYKADYSINKEWVSKFVTDSLGDGRFARMLLFTTTDRLTPEARRQCAQHSVSLRLRDSLLEVPFTWGLDSSDSTWPPGNHPRPDQEQAVDDVLVHFRTSARGQLLRPCGTGKTLIQLLVAQRLDAQVVLYCAPTLALIDQTIKQWTRDSPQPFRGLAVCSDKTVIDNPRGDLDASELMLEHTSDTARIEHFLRGAGPR